MTCDDKIIFLIPEEEREVTQDDYLYCKTCDSYADGWKTDEHTEHEVRGVLCLEYDDLVQNCLDDGCLTIVKHCEHYL
jgi:hypothetical protein